MLCLPKCLEELLQDAAVFDHVTRLPHQATVFICFYIFICFSEGAAVLKRRLIKVVAL